MNAIENIAIENTTTTSDYAEAFAELTNNGTVESAVAMMDPELREALHNIMAPCSEEIFFMAYAEAHFAKYGEEWEPMKINGNW